MVVTIKDLPPEVLVFILKYLNITDIVENCSKTCVNWKEITAQFFMQPRLLKLSKSDKEAKRALEREGWSKNCQDYDFIICLHEKYCFYKGRILVISGSPQDLRHQKLEIIDLSNLKLKCRLLGNDIVNEIPTRTRSVGGLLKGLPIICGGRNQKGTRQCETLQDAYVIQPGKSKMSMLQKREAAAGVVINQDTLWVLFKNLNYYHSKF